MVRALLLKRDRRAGIGAEPGSAPFPRTGTPGAATRRRFLVKASVAGTVVAVVVASAHVAWARFTAREPTATSTSSAGTVTLTSNAGGACGVTNMLPGATPTPCTLTAAYSGSSPGYVALDVLVETQAGNGGTRLYNPTDGANDLQVSITSTSPSVTYTVPTAATTCPSGAPAGSTCYELDDELVSTTALSAASPTVTFTTTVSLPSTTTTGYRGGAAQIVLTAHAAQSRNSGSVSGCAVGHSCTTVSWS